MDHGKPVLLADGLGEPPEDRPVLVLDVLSDAAYDHGDELATRARSASDASRLMGRMVTIFPSVETQ
ncbi:MAG: hypothetical protein RhofKO_42530 [Rhodothermales bacterium]